MTGGALPEWGPLSIHSMADTSWVPALGSACGGGRHRQESGLLPLGSPGQQSTCQNGLGGCGGGGCGRMCHMLRKEQWAPWGRAGGGNE